MLFYDKSFALPVVICKKLLIVHLVLYTLKAVLGPAA